MKQKYVTLLYALRKDGRKTLTTISKETQIPISTIYERLRKEYGDLIKKYTVLLDFSKLGYNVRIHFILKTEKQHRQGLYMFLNKHGHVNNLYRVNQGFDFMCDALFQNIQEAETFIEVVTEKYMVKKMQFFYILEELKRETFFEKPIFE